VLSLFVEESEVVLPMLAPRDAGDVLRVVIASLRNRSFGRSVGPGLCRRRHSPFVHQDALYLSLSFSTLKSSSSDSGTCWMRFCRVFQWLSLEQPLESVHVVGGW